MASKDSFLVHTTQSLWPYCSCNPVVLPLEPRLKESIWNLASHKTSCMLALKASALKCHILSSKHSHGHSCDSWVELYNLPPGRGTEVFGTSNTVYHRHVRQNTSKLPTYCLIPIQNLPEFSLDSVTWHHCVLCLPSWKLQNHF